MCIYLFTLIADHNYALNHYAYLYYSHFSCDNYMQLFGISM